MKKIDEVLRSPAGHWVGDGFPVRSLFSYQGRPERLSPFLLLDYAGPHEFGPAAQPHGVGEHPHRGFETVTIVYQGEPIDEPIAHTPGHVEPGLAIRVTEVYRLATIIPRRHVLQPASQFHSKWSCHNRRPHQSCLIARPDPSRGP